ncbi:MAG TPA: transposase [Paracoccus sp.]|nr:transposase [Paracoccus sp. (in: a-proteobacteria)]
MGEVSIIGVDLAKNVFQLHGAAADGPVVYRKKRARPQFARFMAGQSPCLVAMEACASAYHWAREMVRHGHEVRRIAPHYVKPFIKRQRLGLVPRQYSSGGKERLGRIPKAGQTDIRYLLIIGAISRLTMRARKSVQEGSWLARMLHRKPLMLVAIALANKMARAIWAMTTKKEDYRDPALAVSI